jgi:hypothetical protein
MKKTNKTVVCMCCGETVLKENFHKRLGKCDTCRVEYARMSKLYGERVAPWNRITREIEEYNKEHGTLLTYGQYVSMKKIEEDRKKAKEQLTLKKTRKGLGNINNET